MNPTPGDGTWRIRVWCVNHAAHNPVPLGRWVWWPGGWDGGEFAGPELFTVDASRHRRPYRDTVRYQCRRCAADVPLGRGTAMRLAGQLHDARVPTLNVRSVGRMLRS